MGSTLKVIQVQRNGKNAAVHVSLLVSVDRTDDCYSVSSAAAAGVLPHAAGVALRLHRLPGTFRFCR